MWEFMFLQPVVRESSERAEVLKSPGAASVAGKLLIEKSAARTSIAGR